MTSRKLNEVAAAIDDASTVVEELQDSVPEEPPVDPDADAAEKLEELHEILEHASDTVDEIGDEEEKK
jgi:hypothetical protein